MRRKHRKLNRVLRAFALRARDLRARVQHDALVFRPAIVANVFVDRHELILAPYPFIHRRDGYVAAAFRPAFVLFRGRAVFRLARKIADGQHPHPLEVVTLALSIRENHFVAPGIRVPPIAFILKPEGPAARDISRAVRLDPLRA